MVASKQKKKEDSSILLLGGLKKLRARDRERSTDELAGDTGVFGTTDRFDWRSEQRDWRVHERQRPRRRLRPGLGAKMRQRVSWGNTSGLVGSEPATMETESINDRGEGDWTVDTGELMVHVRLALNRCWGNARRWGSELGPREQGPFFFPLSRYKSRLDWDWEGWRGRLDWDRGWGRTQELGKTATTPLVIVNLVLHDWF